MGPQVPWDRDLSPFAAYQAGSQPETLLVAFSHRDMPAGEFSQYRILQDLPYARLFVNCPPHTWYLDGIPPFGTTVAETAAGIRREAARRGARRIACFGFSMGGYAALVYGPRIGADAVMAFSAEALIGTPFGRSEEHLNGRPCTQPTLVADGLARFDPARVLALAGEEEAIDILQALLIARDTPVEPRLLARCEHGTVPFLHERKLLIPLIRALVETGSPNSEVARALRRLPELPEVAALPHDRPAPAAAVLAAYRALAERLPSAALLLQVGLAHRRDGDERHALDFLRRAYQAPGGGGPHYARHLGRQLLRVKDHKAAVPVLAEALELGPGSDAADMLAVALTALRRLDEAEAVLADALAGEETPNPRRRLKHGRILVHLQRFAEAEQAFAAVLAVEPGSVGALYELGYLQVRRGERRGAALFERALALDTDTDNRRLQSKRFARLQLAAD